MTGEIVVIPNNHLEVFTLLLHSCICGCKEIIGRKHTIVYISPILTGLTDSITVVNH